MPRGLILFFVTTAGLLLSPPAFAGTSNSLLDISPDGARLLAANPDSGTVKVVDTAGGRAVREIHVGEKPESVTWIGNGPLAAVTAYRDDRVVFFNADDGQVICKLAVPAEPYGMVANRTGSKLWVTHEYPGSV